DAGLHTLHLPPPQGDGAVQPLDRQARPEGGPVGLGRARRPAGAERADHGDDARAPRGEGHPGAGVGACPLRAPALGRCPPWPTPPCRRPPRRLLWSRLPKRPPTWSSSSAPPPPPIASARRSPRRWSGRTPSSI